MIRKNLTKQDIAEKINAKLGFSREEAKTFIESLFAIIESKVISGEEVKIPKLGNFSSKDKKERYGRRRFYIQRHSKWWWKGERQGKRER